MNTTFEVHPIIASLLQFCGYDVPRINRSVDGELKRAKLEKGSIERSDVKATETKSKSSFGFTETTKDEYKGKDVTGPIRFAAFHDALMAVWKKHGAPSDDLESMAIVPAHLCTWLAKFRTADNASETTGNGTEGNRADAGNIQSVPTPGAPTSGGPEAPKVPESNRPGNGATVKSPEPVAKK